MAKKGSLMADFMYKKTRKSGRSSIKIEVFMSADHRSADSNLAMPVP